MAGARGGQAAHRTTIVERRERRATVEDPAIVLDAAAAFLSVRPRSIGETRRRLQTLGYRADLIDHVIERLTAYGYLDDAAFGRAWLESRDRARPRGAHALRSELLAKGLERDLVATLLAEREGEGVDDADASGAAVPDGGPDLAAARRLLARRWSALAREPDPRRRRQRAYALLARGGFDPDVIRQALVTDLDPDTEHEPDSGP